MSSYSVNHAYRGQFVPRQEGFEVSGAGGLGQFGEEEREIRVRLLAALNDY
jgi:hypothetical protein